MITVEPVVVQYIDLAETTIVSRRSAAISIRYASDTFPEID
jgi:hypothetical protein